MLDAYGLAAAHLSAFKRAQDQAKAKRDLGLATVAPRRPDVLARLASALRRLGRRRRAATAVGRSEEEGSRPSACLGRDPAVRVAA